MMKKEPTLAKSHAVCLMRLLDSPRWPYLGMDGCGVCICGCHISFSGLGKYDDTGLSSRNSVL
jgi:hypothetical protein